MFIHAVDRPEVSPFRVSDKFHMQIVYFMTPGGNEGVPKLAEGHYWIRAVDAKKWLDDGGVEVVSPLSADTKAEIELTEEQESWLEWMVEHGVEHVRLVR
jgi:hypothetical protein